MIRRPYGVPRVTGMWQGADGGFESSGGTRRL